jgi:hypothetical protein
VARRALRRKALAMNDAPRVITSSHGRAPDAAQSESWHLVRSGCRRPSQQNVLWSRGSRRQGVSRISEDVE